MCNSVAVSLESEKSASDSPSYPEIVLIIVVVLASMMNVKKLSFNSGHSRNSSDISIILQASP